MTDPLRQLLRQPAAATTRAPAVGVLPAVVTRSDAGGVFVSVIGSATSAPLGPCRAATHVVEIPVSIGTDATAYRYQSEALPVGTTVVVANTGAGPFVLAYDLPGGARRG